MLPFTQINGKIVSVEFLKQCFDAGITQLRYTSDTATTTITMSLSPNGDMIKVVVHSETGNRYADSENWDYRAYSESSYI